MSDFDDEEVFKDILIAIHLIHYFVVQEDDLFGIRAC